MSGYWLRGARAVLLVSWWQRASAQTCNEFQQCCYNSCECDSCWTHTTVCQDSPPSYGDASTMINGAKRCPFDPTSSVCTSSSCYFWQKDSGGKRYLCAAPACDTIILSYCGTLGYTHPSVMEATLPTLSRIDLGCQMLIRVGVAPYTDWAQEYDVPPTAATATDWPSAYYTRTGPGGTTGVASYWSLHLSMVTAPSSLSDFRTQLATALATDQFYVYVNDNSAASTSMSARVYRPQTGAVATKIASQTYLSDAALSAYGTVTENSAPSWIPSTSRCYCANPAQNNCGTEYSDAAICPADSVAAGYKSSTDLRTGVASEEAGQLDMGGMMTGVILAGSIMLVSAGLMWLILACCGK